MDLFDSHFDSAAGEVPDGAPLAVRMRPRSIEEVIGQSEALAPHSPLRRLIEDPKGTVSIILWGPPGCGKTTCAYLVARAGNRKFVELSAVSAGVKDVRAVIDTAKRDLVSGRETVLFIDELHRFSKTQQDALLPGVENGWVSLIGATTENPVFSIVSPLLSRSILVTLTQLGPGDISQLVVRALTDKRGFAGELEIAPDARETLAQRSAPDARRALTWLEAAAEVVRGEGRKLIELGDIEVAASAALHRYDRDDHYDVTSAFIKSMRGSDPDAALHYLARMIVAGEDPRFIARRIMIAASEEVGMADPNVLVVASAAAQAVAQVGMPEARLILAEAVLAVTTAPKSNATYRAINAAISDVQAGKGAAVPLHLRDSHNPNSDNLDSDAAYRYPHDYPQGIVQQRYLPDDLQDARYYEPSERGFEATVTKRLARIREMLQMG